MHAVTAALWFGGLVGLVLVLAHRYRQARERVLGPASTDASASSTTSDERAPALVAGSTDGGVAVLDRTEVTADVSRSNGGGDRVDGRTEGDDPRPPASDAPDAPDAPDATGPPPGDAADTAGIIIRFSSVATVAIVLLALAGTTLSWIELGSLGALTSTGYGRTLLVKLVLVAAVVVVAIYNHFRLVPSVLGEHDDADDHDVAPEVELGRWRRLLTTVRLEVLVIVAVLAVTAVLVNVTPGKTNVASAAGPFNQTQALDARGQVNLVVSPAKAGNNALHVTYLTNDGRTADLALSVTVEMSLPDKGVGPLERPVTKAGPGHFVVLSTPDLSIPGTWTVTLVSRTGEFDQERTTFSVPIS